MAKQLPSDTYEMKSGCGSLFIHIMFSDDTRTKIVKVHANLGKSGGCARAQLSSYCDLISYLFNNIPINHIIGGLASACGHKCQFQDECCSELVNRCIADVIEDLKPIPEEEEDNGEVSE